MELACLHMVKFVNLLKSEQVVLKFSCSYQSISVCLCKYMAKIWPKWNALLQEKIVLRSPPEKFEWRYR